jgi:hypothetical protein
MMTDVLTNFLVDLASDPEQMSRAVPDGAVGIERWGGALTDDEKTAVLSGDDDRIWQALAKKGPKGPKTIPQHAIPQHKIKKTPKKGGKKR